MQKQVVCLLLAQLLFCIIIPSHIYADPIISVNPQSIETILLNGETVEYTLTVTNWGDQPLRFSVSHEITNQPDANRNMGPNRDDLGAVLDEFTWGRARGFHKSGIAWDSRNELMWLTTNMRDPGDQFMETSWIAAIDLSSGEEIFGWNTPWGHPSGATWFNDYLYVVYAGQNYIGVSDREASDHGIVRMPFIVTAIASTGENLLVMVDSDDREIVVLNSQMEQVGVIDNYLPFIDNHISRSICWVEDHHDGHLWMNTEGHAWQLAVNDDWEVTETIQDFDWNGRSEWDGIGHDGNNLWLGGFARNDYLIVDDGIEEAAWLVYSHDEHEVDARDEIDFFLTLNAFRLTEGDWEAELHFMSNDPDNPDISVDIALRIQSAPDISTNWEYKYGFPAELNWNLLHDDLFAGLDYEMEIKVRNDGTSELTVQGISADLDVFSAEPSEFSLQPRESESVVITLSAPGNESDLYETNLVITSNDPDEEEYTISLSAEASLPPVIGVEPNEIVDELFTGQSSEHQMVISNEGQAVLRFDVMSDFISVLDEERGFPGRDDAGLVLDEFPVPFCDAGGPNPGIAWDHTNQWMWLSRPGTPYLMMALDPAEDYQLASSFYLLAPGMGTVLIDEVFYIICRLEDFEVDKYTINGEYIGEFELDMGESQPQALTGDPLRKLLFILDSENIIHVCNLDCEQLATIDNYLDFTDNHTSESICWVPEHPAGQLWLNTGGRVWQLEIDTDNWEIIRTVQDFPICSGWNFDGIGHDGTDLWTSDYRYGLVQIVDDNTTEINFLRFDPEHGEVDRNDHMNVAVTLNASELIEGDYETRIHVLTNDPHNPDVEIPVVLQVNPSSVIEVRWSQLQGYPEMIDFNTLQVRLFCGGPYSIPTTVTNSGAGDLEITDISSGNEAFSVEPVEFTLAPREERIITLTLDAEDSGELDAILTISNSSENQPELEIPVCAMVSDPPILAIEPDFIEAVLPIGGSLAGELTISNRGNEVLTFWSDAVPVEEQDNFAVSRTLRSVDGIDRKGAVQRDDAGEIVNEFQWEHAAEIRIPKAVFAWDNDHHLMWLTSGTNLNWIGAIDPAQNFQEQISFQTNRAFQMGAAWLDGVLYVVFVNLHNYPDGQFLGRWDIEGNNLGLLNLPFLPADITSDGERLLVVSESVNREILVIDTDGEQIAVIDDYLPFINYQRTRSICWDNSGIDRRMWINTPGHVWQIALNEEWETVDLIRDFTWSGRYESDGIGHDGKNLWLGDYNLDRYLIVDDGINDVDWLRIDPPYGELNPDEISMSSIIIAAEGLEPGLHTAEIHVHSNDPANSDVAVRVELEVLNSPDIDLSWQNNRGVNEINWNEFFENIFLNEDYNIELTVSNIGTLPLEITNIESDNAVFTAERDEFVVEPGEETIVNLSLRDEGNGGLQNGTLTIRSNDPDEETVEITMTAFTGSMARIIIDPVEIVADVFDVENFQILIANEGNAILRWAIELDEIWEPERDEIAPDIRIIDLAEVDLSRIQVNTSKRSEKSRKPLRDEPEGRFALFQYTGNRLFDMEDVFNGIEGLDYDIFRNQGAFDDVDLDEYNVVWITDQMPDAWRMSYNDNLERFEEFVAKGGAYYMCTSSIYDNWINYPVHPGGLVPRDRYYETRGEIVVSPEENEFIDLMDWHEGLILETDNWYQNYMCHCGYLARDLQRIENSDFYQVIMVGFINRLPITVVYRFGDGWCVVTGTDDRNLYDEADYELWGQSGEAMIQYLDMLSNKRSWLTIDPESGELEPGNQQVLNITVDPRGMMSGVYETDMHVVSNDPFDPDFAVLISITIVERGIIDVDPGGPEEGEPPLEFGTVYLGYPETQTVEINNNGNSDLIVEGVDIEEAAFTVADDLFPIRLESGQSSDLDITFDPDRIGIIEAVLLFRTNDALWQGGYPVTVTGEGSEVPVLTLDPVEIDAEVAGNQIERTVTLTNAGGSLLSFTTRLEFVDDNQRDERRSRTLRSTTLVTESPGSKAPHRDDPPQSRYALFAQTESFNFDMENMFLTVEGLDYDRYRDSDAFADVDLNRYDAVWIVNDQPPEWIEAYNDNIERFEEYVAEGGVYYMCSAAYQPELLPIHPGGLTPIICYERCATIVVSQEDNFLIDYMNWNEGILSPESNFPTCYTGYGTDDLQEIENAHEVQVILISFTQQVPIVVAYRYGQGWCVVTGTADGYVHRMLNHCIWGQTGEAMLRYLDYLAHYNRWFFWEPEEGVLEIDESLDVTITLDGSALVEDEYHAELHFLSNDPENPDQILNVNLQVSGLPMIDADPLPFPFEDAQAVEFPDTYKDGGEVSLPVVITNIGSSELVIDRVELTNADEFSTILENGTVIPAGDELEINLFFHPVENGEREGSVHLYTNAVNVGGNEDRGHIWFDMVGFGQAPPEIGTDPEADGWIHVYTEPDDRLTRTFTVRNSTEEGGFDLSYRIETEEAGQMRDTPDRQLRSVESRKAPCLDDAGDILDDLRIPNGLDDFEICHMAWDSENDWMWLSQWQAPYTVVAVNPDEDYRVMRRFNAPEGWFQIGWIDGVLYGSGRFDDFLYRFDTEGNNIGNLDLQFESDGIATDPERGLLIITEMNNDARWPLHVLTIDGVELGVIAVWDHLHAIARNNCWIAAHSDGPLWIRDAHTLYQFEINMDNWQINDVVQEFQINELNNIGGHIAHDGNDLWINRYNSNQCWVVDDGIDEVYRIVVEPERGTLAPGQEEDITLRFDTRGMDENEEYLADLLITTNDPHTPTISLHVRILTGAPAEPWFYSDFIETETWHSLRINSLTFNGRNVLDGWEIGVFTPDGVPAGGSVWLNDEDVSMRAYGDEPAGAQVEGFIVNEEFHFRAWDWETDCEFEPEPLFLEGSESWNPDGETTLELHMQGEGNIRVLFNPGWNMISVNVIPPEEFWVREEGPDVVRMMEQLRIDENTHHIVLMKNEFGRFYYPAQPFNDIPFWNLTEGYLVKVDDEVEAEWNGEPIPADSDVPLSQGWNMVAFFPAYDLSAAFPDYYVLSPIIDQLILAKDVNGNFMAPEFGFSDMEDWQPSKGYLVKVSEDVILNYPPERNEAAAAAPTDTPEVHWTPPAITGENMSVLLTSISGISLDIGDQAAAFDASGRLVGAGDVHCRKIGFAIWGDEPLTDAVEGLRPSESFSIRLWNAENEIEIDLEPVKYYSGSDLIYCMNGFVVLDMKAEQNLPNDYYLAQNFPNPFNSTTRIDYGLPETASLTICVYDISGRLVATLMEGTQPAGHHSILWQPCSESSGVYIIRLESNVFTCIRKAVLIR